MENQQPKMTHSSENQVFENPKCLTAAILNFVSRPPIEILAQNYLKKLYTVYLKQHYTSYRFETANIQTVQKNGNKTANINVKKLISLKHSVRSLNHTSKTAQIILARTLDRTHRQPLHT